MQNHEGLDHHRGIPPVDRARAKTGLEGFAINLQAKEPPRAASPPAALQPAAPPMPASALPSVPPPVPRSLPQRNPSWGAKGAPCSYGHSIDTAWLDEHGRPYKCKPRDGMASSTAAGAAALEAAGATLEPAAAAAAAVADSEVGGAPLSAGASPTGARSSPAASVEGQGGSWPVHAQCLPGTQPSNSTGSDPRARPPLPMAIVRDDLGPRSASSFVEQRTGRVLIATWGRGLCYLLSTKRTYLGIPTDRKLLKKSAKDRCPRASRPMHACTQHLCGFVRASVDEARRPWRDCTNSKQK